MRELFKTKVRKIGTSFGVLIPKKLMKQQKIKSGDEVEIALLKKKQIALIEKAFGIAKGSGGFERDDADRVF